MLHPCFEHHSVKTLKMGVQSTIQNQLHVVHLVLTVKGLSKHSCLLLFLLC